MISSAVESCGQKQFRITARSEKRTPWWNQDVKEAIQAKKDAFMLQNRSSSDWHFWYSEARKSATQAAEISKERSWEEFGLWLDSNYLLANKVFWQTIVWEKFGYHYFHQEFIWEQIPG